MENDYIKAVQKRDKQSAELHEANERVMQQQREETTFDSAVYKAPVLK